MYVCLYVCVCVCVCMYVCVCVCPVEERAGVWPAASGAGGAGRGGPWRGGAGRGGVGARASQRPGRGGTPGGAPGETPLPVWRVADLQGPRAPGHSRHTPPPAGAPGVWPGPQQRGTVGTALVTIHQNNPPLRWTQHNLKGSGMAMVEGCYPPHLLCNGACTLPRQTTNTCLISTALTM